MSTNYYRIDDDKHIGKLVSNGREQGCTFIWAAEKDKILELCLHSPHKYIVRDATNHSLTGIQFLALLLFDAADHDFSQVGEEFR